MFATYTTWHPRAVRSVPWRVVCNASSMYAPFPYNDHDSRVQAVGRDDSPSTDCKVHVCSFGPGVRLCRGRSATVSFRCCQAVAVAECLWL